MHTSGRMVFTMTLLAAATPFVLPRVLAPAGGGNPHPAAIGTAHPANFGNTHPADFGNNHPADLGDTHPALTAETHVAFPNEVSDQENVTIDPSHVHGNVTFAFPHAAHVTIVLPDGVQFAVNDSRGLNGDGHHGDGQNHAISSATPTTPGAAVVKDQNGQLLPPLGSEVVKDQNGQVLPPAGSTVVKDNNGQLLPPAGAGAVTQPSAKGINEPAGAQPHVRFRDH